MIIFLIALRSSSLFLNRSSRARPRLNQIWTGWSRFTSRRSCSNRTRYWWYRRSRSLRWSSGTLTGIRHDLAVILVFALFSFTVIMMFSVPVGWQWTSVALVGNCKGPFRNKRRRGGVPMPHLSFACFLGARLILVSPALLAKMTTGHSTSCSESLESEQSTSPCRHQPNPSSSSKHSFSSPVATLSLWLNNLNRWTIK